MTTVSEPIVSDHASPATIACIGDARARALVAAKAGRSISVAIPARNEAQTIGSIVEALHRDLTQRLRLVDEIVVMDHDSTDATARVAAAAGARVVSASRVAPALGPALGKGDVLWRSVLATEGDIITWIDADLASFTSDYVMSLVAPLLENPAVGMVRADYVRMNNGQAAEGGRVTELTARPMLQLLYPHLAHIRQPLGGEYAIRRDVAEAVEFETDYGVEIGLLIDVARDFGTDAIAQVDLEPRIHRNRPLSDLHVQAGQIMRTMLTRSGVTTARIAPPRRPAIRTITTPARSGCLPQRRAGVSPIVRPA